MGYSNVANKEVLQEALELMGPNGEHWVPRAPLREDGEQCAVTAIREAGLNLGKDYPSAWTELAKHHDPILGTAMWNDQSTWSEVKATFERAIEAAQ